MLLKRLSVHINTEIVSTIKSVKYVYKGYDAASVIITDETEGNENFVNHDEIQNHINTRYVSSIERCDRILGRQLQKKSHSIMCLPVHLPNQ